MRKKGHNCSQSLAATIVALKLAVVRIAMSAAIAAAMVSGFDTAPAAAGEKETNRGLSSQEVGRRSLEEQVSRTTKTQIQTSGANLKINGRYHRSAKFRIQKKKDTSTSGIKSLR